ncbi:MAG: hypothetical protein ABI325_01710 [Ginsengibacter sp.]
MTTATCVHEIETFFGYPLTIVLIAIVYSDKLQRLSVALGIAGVVIAFALQEVIVSFAGWLAIIFGGFYKTRDRVQLGCCERRLQLKGRN